MLFLGVKLQISHKWFRKTICSVDIIYVISGTGTFYGGESVIELNPGTLVFYPYGVSYRIQTQQNNEALMFYTMNFDFSHDFDKQQTMIPQNAKSSDKERVLDTIPKELSGVFLNVISFKNAIWAEKDIERICREAINNNDGCLQICDALLKILIINIYRKALNREDENPICREIRTLVSKNLQLNIQALADLLHYHPFYLNEVFKKHCGITLHKYIVKQRLIKARELICETKLSLADIAFKCGFSSQAHFSCVFRKTYGITPKALRRRI